MIGGVTRHMLEGLNGVVAFWLFYGYRLIFFSYGYQKS